MSKTSGYKVTLYRPEKYAYLSGLTKGYLHKEERMKSGTNISLFDDEEVVLEIDGGLHTFQSESEHFRPIESMKPVYKDRIFTQHTFLIAA